MCHCGTNPVTRARLYRESMQVVQRSQSQSVGAFYPPYFRSYDMPPDYNAIVGTTLLGAESLAELQDLLVAKDANVNAIQSSVQLFQSEVQAKDPAGLAAWQTDWTAFLTRYQAAHDAATQAIANALPTSSLASQGAQAQYDAVLKAFQVNYPAQQWVRGDYPDLAARWDGMLAEIGQPAVNMANTPQPQKSSDLQMQVYQGLAPYDVAQQAQNAAASLAASAPNAAKTIGEYVLLGTLFVAGVVLLGKVI